MTLRFAKSRHDDRQHTLTCIRDDGSTIGQRTTDFFVLHDLTHYAIESTLGLTEAFYGLLNSGWDFGTFEEREPGTRRAKTLPVQAHFAEVLAGTYDMESVAGIQPDEDRLARLREVGVPEPHPTPEQFETIRRVRSEWHARWRDLAPGDILEIGFPK